MKRSILFLLVASSFSATAFAGGFWGDRDDDYRDYRPTHSMPEPTSVLELSTVAAGLGFAAFRLKKAK